MNDVLQSPDHGSSILYLQLHLHIVNMSRGYFFTQACDLADLF